MSGLFSKPAAPQVPEAPPPAPAVDNAAIEARNKAERDEQLRRAAAGRASTIYTSGAGDTTQAGGAKKVLLG